jgi:release factor glutamine methyltransferase
VLDYQIKLLEAKVKGVSINKLFDSEKKLSKKKSILLKKQIELLKSGYPIDYIFGEIEILGLKLKLNESILIPRPETEEWLLELGKNLKNDNSFENLQSIIQIEIKQFPKKNMDNSVFQTILQNNLLVDLGCGSGIIGLYLSKFFDKVIGIDISKKAIQISEKNAENNKKTNVYFAQCNGLSRPVLINRIEKYCESKKVGWTLVANLPYLPIEDKNKESEHNVKFEPDLALYSGVDGLYLFREVVDQLKKFETKPKEVIFELDPRNIRAAKSLLEGSNYETNIWIDAGGFERVLIGTLRTNHS